MRHTVVLAALVIALAGCATSAEPPAVDGRSRAAPLLALPAVPDLHGLPSCELDELFPDAPPRARAAVGWVGVDPLVEIGALCADTYAPLDGYWMSLAIAPHDATTLEALARVLREHEQGAYLIGGQLTSGPNSSPFTATMPLGLPPGTSVLGHRAEDLMLVQSSEYAYR